MSVDSDVALLGTGLAPLIAAKRLLEEGKSVLLLNPDFDYFREDSELPLDPLLPGVSEGLSAMRLMRSTPEAALKELRPDFPGPIELWPAADPEDFHDALAPHLRVRSRLWVRTRNAEKNWDKVEDLYVEASDAGLNPQILEGILALKRFPGVAARAQADQLGSVLIPRIVDVDVLRYRNGLLEFLRERLEPKRIVCAASQIDLIPEGLRFHTEGVPKTARLKESLLIFWTPRLTSWVLAHAKLAEVFPVKPKGVRIWEEWSLVSREAVDPNIVGVFEDMVVWAEVEGAPSLQRVEDNRLVVLRPGPLVDADSASTYLNPRAGMSWASQESFAALSHLCHDFLKWDKFSVRSMRPRAIFEWSQLPSPWVLSDGAFRSTVIPGCEGPLTSVIRTAREAMHLRTESA